PKDAVEQGVLGLFYGGGLSQFWAEVVGVTACFVTLSVLSIIVYKIVEAIVGNRVPEETEIEGLDIPEMGVLGYSGAVANKSAETPHSRDTAHPQMGLAAKARSDITTAAREFILSRS